MKYLLLLPLLFVSTNLLALIDGQVMIGMRRGKFLTDPESTNLSSNELQLSGHIDPIPLVPVAFGLSLISNTYRDDSGLKNWTSYSVVPEVMAWLPLGDLKPYARVGYSVYSQYKGKIASSVAGQEDAVASATGKGTRLGVGLKYSLLPLVAILAEYNMFHESLKVTKPDSLNNFKAQSSGFLIGVEAGL